MAQHLSRARSRFENTPAEWLPIGGQLSELANAWSSRADIVAYVGKGAGHGSAACFVPHLAEMEVDVAVAFGKEIEPQYIPDLLERSNQFDYPAAMGAVLHEAMHAKHSLFDLAEISKIEDPFERELVTDFEESRVEARGISAFPENRSFLRACALDLVLNELNGEEEEEEVKTHFMMSRLVLLSLARVDAGVLDADDVKKIREKVAAFYGEELLDKLRDIWLRAQAHREDRNWEPLHKLAVEWLAALESAGHDPRSEAGEAGAAAAKALAEMLDELSEAAGSAAVAAGDEATDQALAEQAEDRAREAASGASEQKRHKEASEEVFGRGTGPGGTYTSSRLVTRRSPSGEERAAAVKMAQALERARYQDRVAVRRSTRVPGGRLRSRGALQASAQKAQGMQVTAEPWNVIRRSHVDEPDLKVGLMVDISGSMRSAMNGMGVASWMISEAVRRVQGTAATVYYGNSAWVGMAPGQHLTEVEVYSASDGTEKFNKAFMALEGQMDLLRTPGARLVTIVSDLHYTQTEIDAANKWISRMKQEGIAVIVAVPSHSARSNAEKVVKGNAQVVLPNWSDPTDIGRLIGESAAAKLTELGTGRR